MVNSIIKKSQLEGANRLDAEYYQPEYLEVENKIDELHHTTLGSALEVLTDYHANGSYSILKNHVKLQTDSDYALMVRAIDLQKSNFNDDVRYVSESSYDFLRKTKIYGNELIIDKIGNAGEVYLMPNLNIPVTLGMNLFLLRLKKELSPQFTYIFLNSRYGKLLIHRRVTGTTPLSIDKNSVRSIPIPIFSKTEQHKVVEMVSVSFKEREKSKRLYQQAENLLLEELGLKDFQTPEDLSYIVNYSNTEKVDRTDADYFQPKYEKLITILKKQNIKDFSEVIESVSARFVPKTNENYKYVELANINSSIGVIDNSSEVLGKEAPNRAKRLLKNGDVLVSSIQGSLGKTALVGEDQNGSLASTGFFQFRSKQILPEVLLVLAKNIVLQWQLERECTGTILAAV